ncbi:hypothetical protein [Mycobacterium sp.]
MVPLVISEKLSTAFARWDGRGPTDGDMLMPGGEMGLAVMATLTWDAQP